MRVWSNNFVQVPIDPLGGLAQFGRTLFVRKTSRGDETGVGCRLHCYPFWINDTTIGALAQTQIDQGLCLASHTIQIDFDLSW